MSLGGIGGYLVNKFVKQTKVNSRFAHEPGLDQVGLVEADSDEGAGRAWILWKADPTVWKEQPGLDPSYGVIDQRCELLTLFLSNSGTQILNLDQPFADENNLGDFVDPRHP